MSRLQSADSNVSEPDHAQHYFRLRKTISDMVQKSTEQYRNQNLPKSILLNDLKKLEKKDRNIPKEIPEELTKTLSSITTTIQQKLNEFYEFQGQITPIGSTIDGTKTGQLDEFDYLYVVNHDSVEHIGEEIYCNERQLKASETAEEFMNKVDDIVANLDLTDLCLKHGGFAFPSYSGCRRNGPATTLLFKRENILMSLDFTMAVPLSTEKEMEILESISSKAGPLLTYLGKTVEFLKDTLCLVVVNPDEDDWSVSTARLESKLLHELPQDHCLKIAMRYGKILSKKQVSAIQSGDPDNVNILTDLGPVNVVEESLAQYEENPDKKYLLRYQMRYNHIYLTSSQGEKFSELTSPVVKLDSASLKHLALRIVCNDQPDLAAAEGEESAQIIFTKICEELANLNVYIVENFFYRHMIKMVSVAGFVASNWFDLTCLAKVRCEQFLKSNQLAPEIQKLGTRTPTQPFQFCTRCHQYQQKLLQLYQSYQGISGEADEQIGLPDAYVFGRDSNTDDIALCQTNTMLDESQYSDNDPLKRMEVLAAATRQRRVPSRVVSVVIDEAVIPPVLIPAVEAAILSQGKSGEQVDADSIAGESDPLEIAILPKTEEFDYIDEGVDQAMRDAEQNCCRKKCVGCCGLCLRPWKKSCCRGRRN